MWAILAICRSCRNHSPSTTACNFNNFEFGKINNYLFSQMNNNIFKIDKKLFQSLYFDNLYVRVKENKISI